MQCVCLGGPLHSILLTSSQFAQANNIIVDKNKRSG